jgi:hypothetical protein
VEVADGREVIADGRGAPEDGDRGSRVRTVIEVVDVTEAELIAVGEVIVDRGGEDAEVRGGDSRDGSPGSRLRRP